jgi:hypothetical protein
MSTVEAGEPRIREIRVTDEEIVAELMDGRTISVPLTWSWRLTEATPEERANVRIIGNGQGAHWPDVGRGHQCPGYAGGDSSTETDAVRAVRIAGGRGRAFGT